jgi:hypothetical protein
MDEQQWNFPLDLGPPEQYNGDFSVNRYRSGEFLELICGDPGWQYRQNQYAAFFGFACAALAAAMLGYDIWTHTAEYVFRDWNQIPGRPYDPAVSVLRYRLVVGICGGIALLIGLLLRSRPRRPKIITIDQATVTCRAVPDSPSARQIFRVGDFSSILMKEMDNSTGKHEDVPMMYGWTITLMGEDQTLRLTQSEFLEDRDTVFRNSAALAKAIAGIVPLSIQVRRKGLLSII